jgi:hypothetical protein
VLGARGPANALGRQRIEVEFYDEADGRTRLEIRQWLPEHLAHPSEEGWRQAFTKLDATLMDVQTVAAIIER